MAKEIIRYILMFVILILVQVLICNHIVLFQAAVPMVLIYLIVRLPVDMKVSLVMTIAFLEGLTVDIFSDTPGVNSLACTLIAVMRKPLLYAYVARDDRTKEIVPSVSTLGIAVYSKYLLTVSVIYCALVFIIEYFNFADVKDIVIMSGASGLLTFLLLLGIDSLIISKT